MGLFFSYIRIFVFLGCTLAAIQVPVFVDQYGKSLESHFIESQLALNEFQDDADKFFNGSLAKLIAHYRENGDAVFNAGGRSIASIYERNSMLRRHFEQFQSSSWAAYTQAILAPVPDIGKAVWKNYSYAIQLKPTALAFGLMTGLIFTLVVELLLKLLCHTPKMLHARFRRQHRRA
ncbi:DUF2937 family protein [Vibrio gazogenes]|uniref:DUF2937 domain-containing protein n=1 Tax=Vibrio gazogenes TaxID=687 RepID=A0A1Z2SL27_VIBGA|nr:DUF2937 family protein [Vibrio gazogenes]ASA57826.1 hypothetical protein BSQ33_19040 [Vibrio gazogenes]